ncbi:GrpB family protein [Paenibacillus sp. NPDC056579]|uniref:GrpB family protein n=1 Tax=unclassified Paenibacillus TaxID=185978 RepID=UPI001EF8BC6E|nr:GrpB family protein [Paenibacillus sp. H1-7]ULL13546.1 GrpB family protein [Paenibacillus sp. H1-7]
MTYEVIIQEYTPEWIEEFEKEKLQIHHALNDKAISIEHIGSTSIVGLPAKPIVDIAVGVNLLNDADLFIEPLKELGYEYVPKMEFPNRRFFRKGLWRKGTHHLHIYEITSEEWNNNLLFRNYLKSHPEKLQEYAALKKHLASMYPEDRATYTELKAPFIKSIIELAKKSQ